MLKETCCKRCMWHAGVWPTVPIACAFWLVQKRLFMNTLLFCCHNRFSQRMPHLGSSTGWQRSTEMRNIWVLEAAPPRLVPKESGSYQLITQTSAHMENPRVIVRSHPALARSQILGNGFRPKGFAGAGSFKAFWTLLRPNLNVLFSLYDTYLVDPDSKCVILIV